MERLRMIVSLLSDWKIWIPLLSHVTLQRRVLNLIISHMSKMGHPLLKWMRGWRFEQMNRHKIWWEVNISILKKGLRNRRREYILHTNGDQMSWRIQISFFTFKIIKINLENPSMIFQSCYPILLSLILDVRILFH